MTMLGFRSMAQKDSIIRITGHVSNVQGNPLPNVKIAVPETMMKTSAKKDGAYLVEAPFNGTLIFSADGYKTYSVNIAGRNEINPVLTDSIYSKGYNLNEVVVTARAGASMRNKLATSYSVTNIGYNALSLQAPTSVT